ncbi:hypothetical protein [Qipengyuania sp.]|uniref:hypothetical protein n=1 Tax=Qipengyuania sp. TaxID=2004515 RepID=UPI003734FC9D
MTPLDLSAIAKAQTDPDFSPGGWLTFYLFGEPVRHHAIRARLSSLGAQNLGGAEGGFVYAKVPVRIDRASIGKTIDKVQALALEVGLELHLIDLDSSNEVGRSKIYTLCRAE